jgi:enoyl-CoA hydratase
LPSYETLLLEWRAPGVLGLTLNRPEERNAITLPMHDEIVSCLHDLHDLPDVGAIVLTGAGDTFCAGGSMEMIRDFRDQDWRRSVRAFEGAIRLVQELLMVPPPVIAAVNGHAIGLGATLALLCDVIVMSDAGKIADTHVKAGIVAGDGGALIWPAVLGPARAKELLMTGDPVEADRALEFGLVNRVVPADRVQDEALEIASRLAGGARQAIAWTKQIVNMSLLREAMAQMPLAASLEARTMDQPDVQEGTRAFLERRAPNWPSNEPEQRPS